MKLRVAQSVEKFPALTVFIRQMESILNQMNPFLTVKIILFIAY